MRYCWFPASLSLKGINSTSYEVPVVPTIILAGIISIYIQGVQQYLILGTVRSQLHFRSRGLTVPHMRYRWFPPSSWLEMYLFTFKGFNSSSYEVPLVPSVILAGNVSIYIQGVQQNLI